MAKEHNEYGPGYVKSQVSHHEWRNAENSAEQLLPTLKAMAAQNPHLRLLDVGSGSGTLTASFSKYMPEGQITAVDLSEDILAQAKEHVASVKITNISFQQASVYELPFLDDSFDIVHTSQMLTHLDEPHEAMKELYRVCKKGGVVSARDADIGMTAYWPTTKGIEKATEVMCKFQEATGGTWMGGRKLISVAMKAGIKREQIEASFLCWCYSTPDERQMWANTLIERYTQGPIIDKIRKWKLFTEEDMDEVKQALAEWRDAEDGNMGLPSCALVITK